MGEVPSDCDASGGPRHRPGDPPRSGTPVDAQRTSMTRIRFHLIALAVYSFLGVLLSHAGLKHMPIHDHSPGCSMARLWARSIFPLDAYWRAHCTSYSLPVSTS